MFYTRIWRFGVSNNVLSSVPWAGTSRLVSIMDQVAQRGPNDHKTWSTLIRRADLILKSFSSSNLARMAVILTKSPFADESFLKRLKSQALSKADESDLLSCCGFLYALSKMGLCDQEFASQYRKRVTEQLSTAKSAYPLVLMIYVYSNQKDGDMVNTLLRELTLHIHTLLPQSFSMVLVDVLSNFDDPQTLANLDPFVVNSLNCVNSMDSRSLVQLYSAFSKSRHPLKGQYLQNISGVLSRTVKHASLHQLCVILRGYSRCLVDTELLQAVLNALDSKYEGGDLQELIFVLSHVLRLNLRDLTLTEKMVARIVQFNNIDAVQFSNLVCMAGKHGIPVPASYVQATFKKLAQSFAIKDLALFAHGMHRLGDHSLDSELEEAARAMVRDPDNVDTRSHQMLKQLFTNLS